MNYSVLSLVEAVMQNDTTVVQHLIDQNLIQMNNCLALRTAVYYNNTSMTKLIAPHSDVFSENANAIHLAIENGFRNIFTILLPYIIKKNDADANHTFLLRAVSKIDHSMVNDLARISNLDGHDFTLFYTAYPDQEMFNSLMDVLSPHKLQNLAESLALKSDPLRLELVAPSLTFFQIQTIHSSLNALKDNIGLSERGQECLDIIDQHRQRHTLINAAVGGTEGRKSKI